MTVELTRLIDRLRSLAPFEDESAARHAFDATLKALRRGLVDDEADWLALDLGAQLAAPLLEETYAGQLAVDELYRWMGRFAGVRRSVAKEQTQAVCRALAEQLSPSVLARLRRSVPELAPLFELPEPEEPASGPYLLRDEPAPDHTLAGGRPGGDRPLYDARPEHPAESPAAGRTRTHAHSVAASDDPHADTKLSSARGLTQERVHRSLSTAQPATRK